MCGIVGIATRFSNGFSSGEADVFSDLLFLDTLRGFDSTGVFGVDYLSNVEIHKEASHGLDFLGTPTYKEFRGKLIQRGMFAVGHNRAATRGEIVDKNAHPFWVDDNIILVQNGTMRGDHKKHKDVEVDSEALAHVIAENEDVETALKKINASYALVWYNVKERTLNLIRNSERPLWILELKSGSVVWASEANFLYLACQRNNQSWEKPAVQLEPHELHQFHLDNKKWTRSSKKLDCAFQYNTSDFSDWPYMGQQQQGGRCVTPNFPRTTTGAACSTISDSRGKWQRRRDARHAFDPKARYEVNNLITESLIDQRPDLCVDRAEAFKIANAVNDLRSDKYYCIELDDYLPCNDLPDCAIWYVLGSVIIPNEDAQKAVFYWIVRDKTEEQIMQMVSDHQAFYWGKIASVKSNLMVGKQSVVTAFVSNPCQWEEVPADKLANSTETVQ